MVRVEQADHNLRHNIQKRRVVRDYTLSTYSGLESKSLFRLNSWPASTEPVPDLAALSQ